MSKTLIGTTAILGLFVLSACATPVPRLESTSLRNPIQVSESIERLELYRAQMG